LGQPFLGAGQSVLIKLNKLQANQLMVLVEDLIKGFKISGQPIDGAGRSLV
jgi:hypothetical protein